AGVQRRPHRFDGSVETAELPVPLGELAPKLGHVENLADIRMGDKRLDGPDMFSVTRRVAPFGLDELA
ncbi:MAG: hypothetical protein ACXVHC_07910, partial [Frankiaceae bacterium]